MITIVTVSVLLLGSGVQPQGPDPLIYASSQATYAQSLFEQCQYEQAVNWMQRAIQQVREFRSPQPRERDTAAALLARLEIERHQVEQRARQLRAAPRQLEPLLEAGQLETLRARLSELNPPPCDAALRSLQQQADARAAEAARLVRTADRYLDEGQAAHALKLYRDAERLNRQQAGLQERIARARALKPPGRAAAIVGKVLLTTVVVAGIGYAGYWVYENQKHQNPSAPAPQVRNIPPPVYRSFGGLQ